VVGLVLYLINRAVLHRTGAGLAEEAAATD
jgi:hypothetical protein